MIMIVLFLMFYPLLSKTQTISPTIGITARSTIMNFFNFKSIVKSDWTIPYQYEKNIQGLGFNMGIQLNFNVFGAEYYSSLRYDHTHFDFDRSGTNTEVIHVKEFIVDHNLNFYLINNKVSYGLGISIVNTGEGFHFENPLNVHRFQSIEFKTYNCFIVFPIKFIQVEFKASYIPNGMAYNTNEDYLSYSLRLFHKIKLKSQ